MILLLVSRLYSTPLPQAAGRQLTDRVGTRHGNFTPPRIAPSCPHCVVPVSPGAVAGQEYHDGWRGSDQGSFGSPGRNAKQPATGCFVDGWVPLRTLCAALIGAAVGESFPLALASTGGLRASSSVASALLPGASRQRTYPVAGYLLVKLHEGVKCPLTV